MILNQIFFLSVLAALGVISASLCAPALPHIADHFSTHVSHIQFTISLFLVGNALGQFLSGPLSDRFGQRLILLSGLFIYILASLGCALVPEMSWLLICRVFQGMGSASGPVLARAIAARRYPKELSAVVQSYGAIGIGIASMGAIFASGHLTLVSWRGNFWLAMGLGILLWLWASVTFREASSPLPTGFRLGISHMVTVIRHRLFLKNAFCHSATYGLMYGYIALFPFLLKEVLHGNHPVQVGIYSAYMIACYMLGALCASRFAKRWTTERTVFLGLAFQLVAGLSLSFAPPFELMLGALFFFNFAIGMILPTTSANAMAPFSQSAVGAASSSLGLSYRLIGSLLSMLICQFPLARGRHLGIMMVVLSGISIYFLRDSISETLEGTERSV